MAGSGAAYDPFAGDGAGFDIGAVIAPFVGSRAGDGAEGAAAGGAGGGGAEAGDGGGGVGSKRKRGREEGGERKGKRERREGSAPRSASKSGKDRGGGSGGGKGGDAAAPPGSKKLPTWKRQRNEREYGRLERQRAALPGKMKKAVKKAIRKTLYSFYQPDGGEAPPGFITTVSEFKKVGKRVYDKVFPDMCAEYLPPPLTPEQVAARQVVKFKRYKTMKVMAKVADFTSRYMEQRCDAKAKGLPVEGDILPPADGESVFVVDPSAADAAAGGAGGGADSDSDSEGDGPGEGGGAADSGSDSGSSSDSDGE
jgi:hypothetical protein